MYQPKQFVPKAVRQAARELWQISYEKMEQYNCNPGHSTAAPECNLFDIQTYDGKSIVRAMRPQ